MTPSTSYSMNPSFRNLFKKKLTRDRVVPIISASVSCETAGRQALRLVSASVMRQQEKRAREPLLTGVEQLIDQIGLQPRVPDEHVGEEPIGKREIAAQKADHLALGNDDDRAGHRRARGGQPDRMPGERSLAQRNRSLPGWRPPPPCRHARSPTAGRLRSSDKGRCRTGSPWLKITSERRYVALRFATPAVSRNASTLNGARFPAGHHGWSTPQRLSHFGKPAESSTEHKGRL